MTKYQEEIYALQTQAIAKGAKRCPWCSCVPSINRKRSQGQFDCYYCGPGGEFDPNKHRVELTTELIRNGKLIGRIGDKYKVVATSAEHQMGVWILAQKELVLLQSDEFDLVVDTR